MSDHAIEQHEHHDDHDSPENIQKEVRKYWAVFFALAVGTALTVWVRLGPLHLPEGQAIVVALIIATIKGSLVAGFFMHLLSEKKLIYSVLILTVVFFAVLMYLPVTEVLGKFGYK